MEPMTRAKYIAVIALFAALIAYTYALRYRETEPPPPPDLGLIPRESGGFTSTDESQNAKALEILGADATLFRTYRNGAGGAEWLFIAYFGTPHENSQIHSPKHCYPGAGWNIVEEGRTELSLAGERTSVKHLVIFDGAETHYVLYWFASADGIITNEFALKWNQMKNSLLGRRQASAFVRFSTALAGGETDSGAKDGLARFAETLAPRIAEIVNGSLAASALQERAE